MPAGHRVAVGGIICHVLNRANGRVLLLESSGRWCSLWRRTARRAEQPTVLTPRPAGRPGDWLRGVNRAQGEQEEAATRGSIERGRPFGGEAWVRRIAAKPGLESTLRSRGRRRKTDGNGS